MSIAHLILLNNSLFDMMIFLQLRYLHKKDIDFNKYKDPLNRILIIQ